MTGIVYKFMPSERLTYLENELLRITQPADLNDPFEFLPAMPSLEDFVYVFEKVYKERIDQIDKLKVGKKEKNELKNNEEGNVKTFFVERAANKINAHLGIISLTRRWDSTLMWAHYTNSHKGLCIGFDSNDAFFSDYRQIANKEKIFMPVTYREERIQVPIEKGVAIDFQVVLSKSKDWEYEEEERLLVMLRQANKVIPAEPYDICLYRIPHNLVKEIVVGVNFPNDKFEIVNKFCIERSINLFKCHISETKYDMEREKCSH